MTGRPAAPAARRAGPPPDEAECAGLTASRRARAVHGVPGARGGAAAVRGAGAARRATRRLTCGAPADVCAAHWTCTGKACSRRPPPAAVRPRRRAPRAPAPRTSRRCVTGPAARTALSRHAALTPAVTRAQDAETARLRGALGGAILSEKPNVKARLALPLAPLRHTSHTSFRGAHALSAPLTRPAPPSAVG
jgi:hypothetical protein